MDTVDNLISRLRNSACPVNLREAVIEKLLELQLDAAESRDALDDLQVQMNRRGEGE
jgi:hypothetical protein